ncbi:hypothetical protein E2A64_05945 [Pseudohoeflea suaedae]|uniref:Uncharacterized protein n=1 Tax=Pseudohoeflea suaedae TaxID=877384 RepID=A0A4R5PNS8_9HYPH|nr:hypothetical protein [Pseudohoeflea suaedae]TDH38639.1 hypothetical protein E2A64_05945 [Pseudohoeflea suaedae]
MTDGNGRRRVSAGPAHSVRNAVTDTERAFSLGPDRINWSENGQTQSIRYADISAINLITYAGAGATIAQATIETRDGGAIKIRSHHYKGLARFENRRATYGAFMRELCRRVAEAAPDAKFTQGNTLFMLMWAGAALLMITLAIFVVVIATRTGDLPLMAIFIILVGGPIAIREVLKGGRKAFDPRDPPAKLL